MRWKRRAERSANTSGCGGRRWVARVSCCPGVTTQLSKLCLHFYCFLRKQLALTSNTYVNMSRASSKNLTERDWQLDLLCTCSKIRENFGRELVSTWFLKISVILHNFSPENKRNLLQLCWSHKRKLWGKNFPQIASRQLLTCVGTSSRKTATRLFSFIFYVASRNAKQTMLYSTFHVSEYFNE